MFILASSAAHTVLLLHVEMMAVNMGNNRKMNWKKPVLSSVTGASIVILTPDSGEQLYKTRFVQKHQKMTKLLINSKPNLTISSGVILQEPPIKRFVRLASLKTIKPREWNHLARCIYGWQNKFVSKRVLILFKQSRIFSTIITQQHQPTRSHLPFNSNKAQ